MPPRKKNTGLCWCVHHGLLLEFCYDFAERIRVIKRTKDDDEIPVRLYEMRFPTHKLPAEIIKASADHQKAYRKYQKAAGKPDSEWQRIYNEWLDKGAKFTQTVQKYLPQLEKLHRREVRKTCWNGTEFDFRLAKRLRRNNARTPKSR